MAAAGYSFDATFIVEAKGSAELVNRDALTRDVLLEFRQNSEALRFTALDERRHRPYGFAPWSLGTHGRTGFVRCF